MTKDVTVTLTYRVRVSVRVHAEMSDQDAALVAEENSHPGQYELMDWDVKDAHPNAVMSNV